MVARTIVLLALVSAVAGLSSCAGLATPDDVLDPTDPANATDFEVIGDAIGGGAWARQSSSASLRSGKARRTCKSIRSRRT